jgi:kumamolisin
MLPSPGNAPRRAEDGSGGPPYTPLELAGFYNFPAGTGQGQCVAIVEFNGGARADDLGIYFSALGVNPIPTVVLVSVDGAVNNPIGDPKSDDGEVMLDIEVIGGTAPGAKMAVYFAPNTEAGFIDAVTTAVHDTNNNPSVLSISWGKAESSWTQQSMSALDSAFLAAASMGVTVCAATGDHGSGDDVNDGKDHVDFPASSPNVLACGGTTVQSSGAEFVWNDKFGATGGGVSTVFARPSWQNGLQVTRSGGNPTPLPKRGTPDVSGDADPATGFNVRVDGVWFNSGGTSAVAPLWAGLIARINSARGSSVGFINAQLYGAPSALRDIQTGNNGSFMATPGWDACTGLGSPNGAQVAAVFGRARTS